MREVEGGDSGRRWVIACVAFAALILASCKNKPGDRCRGSGAVCGDRSTRLSCESDRYVPTRCGGPKGCQVHGIKIECDMSGNANGDVCSKSLEGVGLCSSDGSSAVICRAGRFEREPCRGQARCQVNGEKFLCDHTIAAIGDACGSGSACSADGKALLDCKNGKLEVASTCKGPSGCSRMGDNVLCDFSVGEIGDLCRGEGNACSSDGKKFLECEGGKLALGQECRGPDGCRIKGDQVECDALLGEIGDSCEGEGGVCSVDGKAMLSCKGGKLERERRCNRCVVKADEVRCL